MKALLLGCLYSIILSIPVYGHDSTSEHLSFNRDMVRYYNNNDFKSVYDNGSSNYKKLEAQKELTQYFSTLRQQTGEIRKDSLLGSYGNYSVFQWTGEHASLRVEWMRNSEGTFDDYFISDMVPQPAATLPRTATTPITASVTAVVNEYAQLYLQHPASQGLSIGIYRHGKTYQFHFGETVKGSGHHPDSNTVYLLGSIAKTFVALMAAQAVTEHKLVLDSPVTHYLPGQYSNLSLNGTPIRMGHLLNHTSGLPDGYPAPDSFARWSQEAKYTYMEQYNADSLLAALHLVSPTTTPGTHYAYNSNAFHIIVLVLQQIYGTSYETLLQQYVQTHFHMQHTAVSLDSTTFRLLPMGYDANGKPLVQRRSNHGFRGGPSTCSTTSDMLIYIQAQLGKNNAAINLSHQITYHRNDQEALGMAWMEDKSCLGQQRLYHSGKAGSGFHTFLSLYPDEDTGIIVMANETISQSRVSALERALYTSLIINHL